MKIKIFTIQDIKAEVWKTPVFFKTTGVALRAIADLANDNTTDVGKYPRDYCFWEIGEYDDETGEIVVLQAPKSLGLASEFVMSEELTG